jgi:hypothetical protein
MEPAWGKRRRREVTSGTDLAVGWKQERASRTLVRNIVDAYYCSLQVLRALVQF